MKKLRLLARQNKTDLNFILEAFEELRIKGVSASHVKKVQGVSAGLYRKRVGVYRILFNEEGFILRVWLVDRKKGPADYKKWIRFVMNHI